MSDTQWNTISWQEENISTEKLNKMVSNLEYLHDRQVAGRFVGPGVNSEIGVRMISGFSYLAPNTKGNSTSISVSFSGFFSPGCQPAVTTGVIGKGGQKLLMATVAGPSTAVPIPDHTGCRLTVTAYIVGAASAKQLYKGGYVSYTAVGY